MDVTLLGTGSPVPDPEPRRPGHARAGRWHPAARRRRPGRAHAPGRGRRLPGDARRGAAHPPPQRPPHRPQRRDHHPLGHEPGAQPAHGLRPSRHPPGGRRDAGDARPRHLLPPGPPRRPERPARGRRGRGGPRRRAHHRRGPRGGRATDHRPVEPTVGYRVEHEGRAVVLGGDGIPCAGLDALCAGADAYVQTVLREDMVRMVPDGPLPGHPRLPLHRRAGRHHGHPGGRLDPGAHPLRAGPAARPGGRVAGAGRRPLRR